jgi:hypothetical protein
LDTSLIRKTRQLGSYYKNVDYFLISDTFVHINAIGMILENGEKDIREYYSKIKDDGKEISPIEVEDSKD